jgi:glutathione S-transferase
MGGRRPFQPRRLRRGAVPVLADWTHRIDPSFSNVIAYRKRLLARPSFARAVDEARPYRPFFPLGAPDRD